PACERSRVRGTPPDRSQRDRLAGTAFAGCALPSSHYPRMRWHQLETTINCELPRQLDAELPGSRTSTTASGANGHERPGCGWCRPACPAPVMHTGSATARPASSTVPIASGPRLITSPLPHLPQHHGWGALVAL